MSVCNIGLILAVWRVHELSVLSMINMDNIIMKMFTLNKTKLLIGAAIVATPFMSNAGLFDVSDMRGQVTNPISTAPTASGTIGQLAPVNPSIVAGDISGGTAPAVPDGQFTGVVSINTRYANGDSFICTGTLIANNYVVTAAHCVDNPDGSEIDITQEGQDVRVIFAQNGNWLTGSSSDSLVTVSEVTNHPGYNGFGICGEGDTSGLGSQCLGDDIAILKLESDAPEAADVMDFYRGDMAIAGDQTWMMVGHGTHGNGIDGGIFAPDFFTKRYGFNVPELFECDDATGGGGSTSTEGCTNAGSFAEVWRADFDGEIDGAMQDFFCSLPASIQVCGPILGNDFNAETFEASIGGGDSGGPSFIYNEVSGKYELVGNNTFGSRNIQFGSSFGGNIYQPYLAWIDGLVNGGSTTVSAPAGAAFVLASLAFLGLRRRARS